MPNKLKRLLWSLTPEEADRISDYLDGNVNAFEEIMSILDLVSGPQIIRKGSQKQ